MCNNRGMKFTSDQFDALFGSPTALARKLGTDKTPISTVGCWKSRGRIPYDRVLDVEKVTGIPRHKIRPDIYPDPAEEKARA